MELWKVTFPYETPGEYANNIQKSIYMVVAETAEEAATKALADFSNQPGYSDLGLSIEGRVKTTVERIIKKIAVPDLTLPEDKEKYTIFPRISEDKSSLEYIVLQK